MFWLESIGDLPAAGSGGSGKNKQKYGAKGKGKGVGVGVGGRKTNFSSVPARPFNRNANDNPQVDTKNLVDRKSPDMPVKELVYLRPSRPLRMATQYEIRLTDQRPPAGSPSPKKAKALAESPTRHSSPNRTARVSGLNGERVWVDEDQLEPLNGSLDEILASTNAPGGGGGGGGGGDGGGGGSPQRASMGGTTLRQGVLEGTLPFPPRVPCIGKTVNVKIGLGDDGSGNGNGTRRGQRMGMGMGMEEDSAEFTLASPPPKRRAGQGDEDEVGGSIRRLHQLYPSRRLTHRVHTHNPPQPLSGAWSGQAEGEG